MKKRSWEYIDFNKYTRGYWREYGKYYEEGEDMEQVIIGYTVMNKSKVEEIGEWKSLGVDKIDIDVENGHLGKGIYFTENIRQAKEKAKRIGGVILKAEISLKGCMDITKGRYNTILKEGYKKLRKEKRDIIDSEIIDKIIKESKGKIKSVRSIYVTGEKLHSNSLIRENMGIVICVKETEVIRKWKRIDC